MKEYIKEYQKMRENHLEDWGYCADPIDWRNLKSQTKEFLKSI